MIQAPDFLTFADGTEYFIYTFLKDIKCNVMSELEKIDSVKQR